MMWESMKVFFLFAVAAAVDVVVVLELHECSCPLNSMKLRFFLSHLASRRKLI